MRAYVLASIGNFSFDGFINFRLLLLRCHFLFPAEMFGFLCYILVLVFFERWRQPFYKLSLEVQIGIVLAINLPFFSVFMRNFLLVEAAFERITIEFTL